MVWYDRGKLHSIDSHPQDTGGHRGVFQDDTFQGIQDRFQRVVDWRDCRLNDCRFDDIDDG